MARKARAAIPEARARRARERRADARREARGSEGFERATTRIRRATPLASRGASSARAVRLAALSTAVWEQAKRVAPIAKGLNLSHNRHRLGGRRNVATRRHTSPRPHRAVDGDHGVSRDDVGERARARSPSRCASSRRSSARAATSSSNRRHQRLGPPRRSPVGQVPARAARATSIPGDAPRPTFARSSTIRVPSLPRTTATSPSPRRAPTARPPSAATATSSSPTPTTTLDGCA